MTKRTGTTKGTGDDKAHGDDKQKGHGNDKAHESELFVEMLTLTNMEQFEISVEHRGSMKTFLCTFSKFGYSYRFTIDVDGSEVIFEPDEERNLRAIVPLTHQDNSNIRELVPLIGQQLSKVFSG